MIVYKCDGDSFGGEKCSNEAKDDMPEWWLMISGKIKNGLHDAHYIQANGTYHFCSRNCFENFFFKNVNQPIGGALNMNIDPKQKEQEAAGEAAAPAEQATETESAEEGSTEG